MFRCGRTDLYLYKDRYLRANYRKVLANVMSVTTTMALDVALELSVEDFIGVLNQKLFMECTKVKSTVPPTSRALVATLTAEVRSSELRKDHRILMRRFPGRRSGEASQRRSTRNRFIKEFPATCKPSPPRNHCVVRRIRL